MLKIRIAALNVEIDNRYPYTEIQCRDYLSDFQTADFGVAATPAEIEKEQAESDVPCSPGYAEFICVYRKIAFRLPDFGAFVFHASVVECDGMAYAFSAPSGTGKSTHTALWLRVFGARARMINGDKPILRFIDGRLFAFGTPWCGKERQGINAFSPLAALCFLERSTVNRIAPIGNEETVQRLFGQILLPRNPDTAERFLALLDRMVVTVPSYLLGCNMSEEAATVAHNGMCKGEKHDS